METPSAYMRFLALSQSKQAHLGLPGVDATAMKLLEICAVACERRRPLTVTQAMALRAVASPATLHRKIDALLDAGYIDLQTAGGDSRVREIHLREAAQKYFQDMSEIMLAASSPSQSE
ncbi:MAG: hypothetical protein RLZZ24_1519 [Pseudomonadota bacterium]